MMSARDSLQVLFLEDMEKDVEIVQVEEKTDFEIALQKSEEQNRIMLDSSSDGIAMFDQAGTILNINAAFEKRFAKTKREMIGMNMRDLFPKDHYGTLAERRLQHIKEVVTLGQPSAFEDTRDDLFFSNAYYPVFTNGKVTAVTLFSSDVTAEKKAHEEARRNAILMREAAALQKREQEYLEILDGSTEGSWIFDCVKETIEFSPKCIALVGEQFAQPLEMDKFIQAFLLPQNIKCPFEQFETVARKRRPRFKAEFELKSIDKWVLAQGKIIYSEAGKPTKIYGTIMDITERKKTERDLRQNEVELKRTAEELAAKNRLITEFFTNISHELKTPLSIILLQLELMDLYRDKEEKMDALIETAKQNSNRLTRLIGNLREITKIDAGYLQAHYATMDIVSKIQSICDSVAAYAHVKSIRMRFCTSVTEKAMPVDLEKLDRILLNLLSNAIKNTGIDDEILVRLQEGPNNSVRISVSDTGVGIPEDKLGTIFDRFAQVNTSFSRLNEGCGIGLALAKSLAEILGGTLCVESEMGKGSVFTLELPVHDTIEDTQIDILGFNLTKKVEMELSDL